jgi:hypothetical protein
MTKRQFVLVVVDRDTGEFTVEGPMSDDRLWNSAVVNAQRVGRNIRCFSMGNIGPDVAAAEWHSSYGSQDCVWLEPVELARAHMLPAVARKQPGSGTANASGQIAGRQRLFTRVEPSFGRSAMSSSRSRQLIRQRDREPNTNEYDEYRSRALKVIRMQRHHRPYRLSNFPQSQTACRL